MIEQLKTVLLSLCLGIVVGGGLADLTMPGFLNWYNVPGGGDAMCHCADLVHATSQSLLRAQAIGCGLGGTIFLLAGLALMRGRRSTSPARRQAGDA